MIRTFRYLLLAPLLLPLVSVQGVEPGTLAVAALSAATTSPPQLVRPGDWAQWGGSNCKNNTPEGKNIPTDWTVTVDNKTNRLVKEKSANVKWAARLGSQSYGNVTVANGKVYAGTNNGYGWLKRYPASVDLGCLLCFDEKNGEFLWQHSNEKLITGRVHDWPLQGICCAPLIEGDRLWYVTSRGEVVCLDTEGFYDNEDDGPVQNEWAKQFEMPKLDDPTKDKVAPSVAALEKGELGADVITALKAAGCEIGDGIKIIPTDPGKKWTFSAKGKASERSYEIRLEGTKLVGYRQVTVDDKDEADVVWKVSMMKELGTSQHNMCACSVTIVGDTLFVNTGNGVDDGHVAIPAPHAPSFIALDKKTGKLLWKDESPGTKILHGQWSSPSYAVIKGRAQIFFGGGDGWLYAFDPAGDGKGNSKLLWKFDCNPKTSKYALTGATRNHLIGTPVIYNDLVYVGVGEDPEHGIANGHLWCIDPTKDGDVSPELAYKVTDLEHPIPHTRREQAVDEKEGEVARPNPNSAAVWHYVGEDANGDGKLSDEETMHRTCGTVVIKDDILVIPDFVGIVHCLDAKTGKRYWSHDMMAECWSSACIVEDKIYVADSEADISIFKLAKEKDLVAEVNIGGQVYSTPVVAQNVLYLSNQQWVFAIEAAK
jgi:outer membrane protein assembly factor BamB